MNNEVKELLNKETTKHNRYLNIPGIYRHFKQEKNGEDMIYAVSAVSLPVEDAEFICMSEEYYDNNIKEVKDKTKEILFFNHTELETPHFFTLRNKDKYYHNAKEEPEILVIYTALYGDRKTYVRPLSMFISRTDKVKYPNATQKFRLELI